MADKRISQLVERTDIANNDVVPIVASGATTTNKATISSIQEFMQENLDLGVTSVGITLGTTGTDVNVTGSPITSSGNITINIPDASATARGVVNTGTQTFAGTKTFAVDAVINGVNVGRGGGNIFGNVILGSILANNTTGIYNVAINGGALGSNTTGRDNVAIGYVSLNSNTTGERNTAVGGESMYDNLTGSENTAIGLQALSNMTTGRWNVSIGNRSATLAGAGGGGLFTSNNSIYIGYDSRAGADNQTNQIVIGHNAIGQGSNTVTIGNSSTTSNKLFGRVIHADAVNADESATLGQVNTSLGGYVTLGTPQTITGQKTFNSTIVGQNATLTSSGSGQTLLVTHSSGSGIALNITKAGNGEGLRVAKTSGTGNAVTISGGNFEAGTIVKTGGTSTQYLMADGSVSTLTNPVTGTGAQGRVAYWDSTGVIKSDSLFQWDDTFKRLGIGRTPTVSLAVQGAAVISNEIKLESTAGNGLRIYGSSGTNQWDMHLSGTSLRFSDNTGTGSLLFDRPLNGTSASFTGDLTIDTNTFFVDSTNNRVGIGTISPATPFHLLTSGLPAIRLTLGSEARVHNINGVNNGRDLNVLPFRNFSIQTGNGITEGIITLNAYEDFVVGTGSSYTPRLTIANTGAATFSSSVTAGGTITNQTSGGDAILYAKNGTVTAILVANTTGELMGIGGTESNHPYIIRTGNTERMRITSDGYARLSASSGGIQFNGDTAAANALDDYEEGTWTPTIGGTWTTNPTSLSGLYTKIGNMVYIRLEFTGGVKASTTSGWIDGLPFSGAVGGGGTVSNVSVQNRGIALLDNNTRVWLTELDFLGLSTKVMASYRL
jgi:hypothetical protein